MLKIHIQELHSQTAVEALAGGEDEIGIGQKAGIVRVKGMIEL